jgi:hypothetical protein
MSLKAVGEALGGYTRATIAKWLKKEDVAVRSRTSQNPDRLVAVALYERGWTLAAIGETLEYHGSTIRQWLIDAGVALRPRSSPQHKATSAPVMSDDEIADQIAAIIHRYTVLREPVHKVAAALGYSYWTVYWRLRDGGVEMRRPGLQAGTRMGARTKPTLVKGEARKTLAREFAQRYTNGESIRAIATSSRLSYGAARGLLLEGGARLRPRVSDGR